MEKIIWMIGNNRNEMIEAQRHINSTGSMRAYCMLSFKAVEKSVLAQSKGEYSRISTPSLIVIDYDMAVMEDYKSLSYIKKQEFLAGVPIFFMTANRNRELDEECYKKGAMVILRKPFSQSEILRIERMAWQHEVTKNYEKMLQKQAVDLQAAREILRLNEQLKARNELLHQIFGRYFSDELVEVIMEHPEGAVIGGEKRELTVLMSDLRGFTSLSEDLEPEEVTELLNLYFAKMAEAITQYHGTIIELLGDGILAVFGAPLYSDEQTEEAIAAAITMQNLMGEVNAYCTKKKYTPLEMGIGIHRGEAFIGNVGSEKMMRYNVIGKVVNECSRIEGYSVGGQILISKEGLETVSCPVEIHNQMEVAAKGIQKTITVNEVIGIGGKYQLLVANVEFDVLTPVEDWILFNLYPIEEKRVREEAIPARLTQFSCKRAVVELVDFQAEIKAYSDVEIFAAGQDGRAIFTGVYAKVVRRQFDRVTLHFTHISRSFQTFSGRFLSEEEGHQNLKQG
ncbi:MAG: adenylate/guanylate cyclase domain-containing response regulator [Lachnospiraceae bacterium]|nr:adenylate/guanylate cyclase domain-containing response regulator [Lachnospiraceae bacterium]